MFNILYKIQKINYSLATTINTMLTLYRLRLLNKKDPNQK